MEVVNTLHAGDNGTRELQLRYGARLVCVRHRRDSTTRKCHHHHRR